MQGCADKHGYTKDINSIDALDPVRSKDVLSVNYCIQVYITL